MLPIPYGQAPSALGGSEDHSELDKGIKRWVEQLRQSPSDELKQVQQIIARTESPGVSTSGESTLAPSGNAALLEGFRLSVDDEDFLLRTVREPQKVAWFTRAARSLRWVAWSLEKKLLISFAASADPSSETQQAHLQISLWALDRLIETPTPTALELFARLGGKFGPEAWRHCILHLIRAKDDDPIWRSAHLEYWLAALRHVCVDHRHYEPIFLAKLVGMLAKKGFHDHALRLFVRMLCVRIEWKEPWGHPDLVNTWQPQPALFGDLDQIKDAWTALAELRNTHAGCERLFSILSECVEELYAAYGPREANWDPLAGTRGVVDEPSGQFDPISAEDFVADMLCQLIKKQASCSEGIGEARIRQWLGSSRTLWHRLAYLALREDSTIRADRKAEIIHELNLVHPRRWQLQHDPRSLVVALYGGWSLEKKTTVLALVATEPDLSQELHLEEEERKNAALRMRNSFMDLLALRYPGDPAVVAAFIRLGRPIPEDVAEQNNDWEPGEVKIDPSPVSAAEIITKVAGEQLDEVLQFPNEARWGQPTRLGFIREVISAINLDQAWAREFLSALARREDGAGLWSQIGWQLKWLGIDQGFRHWFLVELLPTLCAALWTDESYRSWSSRLLGLADGVSEPPLAPDEWAALNDWSSKAWQACGPDPDSTRTRGKAKEALTRAINHPVGPIIEFWLSSVRQLRRREPTAPYEWPDRIRPLIDGILARDDDFGLMGLAILGQQLRFVRYAFPAWTKEVLYPRFDFTRDPEQARCIWSAWLLYGSLSYELAEDMCPAISANLGRLIETDDETSYRLLSYIAAIATSTAAPNDTLSWLLNILRDITPELRGRWGTEVARSLKGAHQEHQQRLWESWAREYLLSFRQGTFGDPRRTDAQHEFFGFLHWPLGFSAIGGAVLDSLEQAHPHRIKKLDVLFEINQARLSATEPDLCARFLRWIFVDVGADRWGFYGLDDVLNDLPVTAVNRVDLILLRDRLLLMEMQAEYQLLADKIAAYDEAHPI